MPVILGYNNDDGCSGYNESGEMMCKATTHDTFGSHVVIRKGFWDGSNGFGHDKALYYHNLWLQPSIDTIHFGIVTDSASSEHYDVYHYNAQGKVDQYVWVVADNVDDSFQGVKTGDGHSVGLITGWCANGSDALETTCPDWVNQTL
jgi:hypothetical protein